MKRSFPIGAILTVSGDRLLCPQSEVIKLMAFMLHKETVSLEEFLGGENVRHCKVHLAEQFPWLHLYNQTIALHITKDNWQTHLQGMEEQFGKHLEVEDIPKEEFQSGGGDPPPYGRRIQWD